MIKIGIVVGSTRPGRKAEAVARWVYEIARQRGDAEFTPRPHHGRMVETMLDQVIAWSGALKPLREGVASRASA